MPRRPSMQDLSAPLATAARAIAAGIARAGKRALIVGGAPRDLALGRRPDEIDMASAASPAEMESLFSGTIPVGRAFGTVIVRAGGVDVQHTTFRSEQGYSDSRRPDAVAFGATPEEDSARRDFTCNAIYLDPLDDAVLDPQGGLADLGASRLRCVGDPRERFREDGLRLLRLARFAAALDLEPDAGTLEGARSSKEALRGVSPERVLEELTAIFDGPQPARAIGLLADLEVLERAIPGAEPDGRRARIAALGPAPGIALGLAALLAPREPGPSGDDPWLARVEALRPSRALRRRVEEIARAAAGARSALAGPRSERVRWMRSEAFAEAAALARAAAAERGADPGAIDAAVRERAELGDAGLHPAPLVAPADLEGAGIPRGARWGALLSEAEDLQLDGRLRSRDEALLWLRERAGSAPQEGGKTPRRR
jgi:tRNA nucleotidyltransferase/poly(A) polymerase